VDIGGTDIKLGILSPEGEMIIDGTVPTEQESGVAHSAEKVRAWYEENASAGMNLVALGIGCAGLIDREKGTVISSPNLPAWVGESIKEEFESALGRTVRHSVSIKRGVERERTFSCALHSVQVSGVE